MNFQRSAKTTRLIDAELFKKQVAAMAIKNGYAPEKANALCKLIDNQPTAYDIEKVVEEIKESATRKDDIYVTLINGEEAILKDTAIAIVEEARLSE